MKCLSWDTREFRVLQYAETGKLSFFGHFSFNKRHIRSSSGRQSRYL